MLKKKKLFPALVTLILVSATLPALAEESTDKQSVELNPVLVSAKKDAAERSTEKEPVYSRLAVPQSGEAGTQTITRKDIEAMHPKDIIDVIEQGLGVTTTFQGRRNLNFFQVRGNGSLGLIIDGIYIPQTQSGRELANFPLEVVESVQIVRDPTMLTLGPVSAFTTTQGSPNGGFIVIKTRKPTKAETEVKASYGTYHTYSVNTYHGESNGNSYFVADYKKYHTGGKDDWFNDARSGSIYLKGGYADKGLTSNFSFFYDSGSRNFQRGITDTGTMSTMLWGYDPLKSIMLSFDINRLWDKDHITSFSYGFSKTWDDSHSNDITKPLVDTVFAERDYLREFNLSHTIISDSGKNTLKFGSQTILWHTPTGELSWQKKEREEELYGYYISDEQKVNDKLTVDGSARIDRKHITKGIDKYKPSDISTQVINDMWMNNATSYAVGAAYKLDSVYKLSTRIAYSKQPTDAFMSTVNNEALDPEVRLRYELGINADYSKNLHAGLTFFQHNIDGYKIVDHYEDSQGKIVKSSATDAVSVYTDADVKQHGMELSLNGNLLNNLKYYLSYSYIKSDYAPDNATMPHNIYTLRLTHNGKAFDTNLILRKMDSWQSALTDGFSLGDYTRIDLNLSKMINPETKVTVYGRNITDKHYASMYNNGYYYDVGAVYGVEWSKKF
ncbi:TonB-dependent receptor [Sporomusa sp. KB1]|uniref:TonB-dependent receptor n=1 Tax=Sporomusa sp. KB1 TaxID=943346 RepID=UPI0011AC0C24|nr:TonB-dependent receptor plug domain-containing protein [Sporomusa sp. KB1]TWH48121.1 iron complex outermembrane receptor protein [Sporomusa sp. KB1]